MTFEVLLSIMHDIFISEITKWSSFQNERIPVHD